MRELQALDHDLVAERVQRAGLDLHGPRVAEQPAQDVLPLLVETESQKQILVGKKGAMIREIGTRARPEIEALLGHKIFLELVVKVRPRWRRDDATLERLGL